jgi:hypothetical protein
VAAVWRPAEVASCSLSSFHPTPTDACSRDRWRAAAQRAPPACSVVARDDGQRTTTTTTTPGRTRPPGRERGGTSCASTATTTHESIRPRRHRCAVRSRLVRTSARSAHDGARVAALHVSRAPHHNQRRHGAGSASCARAGPTPWPPRGPRPEAGAEGARRQRRRRRAACVLVRRRVVQRRRRVQPGRCRRRHPG